MSDAPAPVESKTKSPAAAWAARWVGPAPDPRAQCGVFLFRLAFRADDPAAPRRIRISADQRYNLWVDGRFVAFGPQRGDVAHWPYDELDLAPHLDPTRPADGHTLVVQVWNYGHEAPMAQHSVRTALVVEGLDDPALSTPCEWRVARAPGWDFAFLHDQLKYVYIDVGPGDLVDGGAWRDALLAGDPEGAEWAEVHDIARAETRGTLSGSVPWNLIPRSIPPMRLDPRAAPFAVRGGFAGDAGRPAPPADAPAGTWVVDADHPLLLDAGELLCAFPVWRLTGDPGTVVEFVYAEAPAKPIPTAEVGGDTPFADPAAAATAPAQKSDRGDVRGAWIRGYADRATLGEGELPFRPLWWRTFRYVLVRVKGPGRATLRAEVLETGYPLRVESAFAGSDPDAGRIWDVAVRTLARCMGETYFDCPYYEQLQYVGDTRIQAQITRYLGRDRALPRHAVTSLGWSQIPEGLTQSRYPSRQMQIIPPFSLWWVLMLHDQVFYDAGPASPEERGRAARILDAWDRLAAGDLGGEFWCFGDWVPAWNWGVPPGGARSTMHRLTRFLAQIAYAQLAKQSLDAGRENFRRELADAYGRDGGLVRAAEDPDWAPSEHAEALYRVAQRMLDLSPDPWPAGELDAAKAARCTYYFQYYLHQARPSADYAALLQPWRDMLAMGLSTFAENPEPTRSDCHAWSAHPILGFFQHVAGVTSRAAGWSRARIAPEPGSFAAFDARIAHPAGELRVALADGRLAVDTPVPAELVWRGETRELAPGRHEV